MNLKRRSLWLQWVVLITCLAMSYVAFALVHRIAQTRSLESFAVLRSQGETSLSRTGEVYERTLGSLAGLFISSTHINNKEMSDFATALNINRDTAGIDMIGFARSPLVDDPDRILVQHIEPRAGNEDLLGLDFSSNAELLATARAARDTHETLLLPNINLPISGELHPRAILIKPVFRTLQTSPLSEGKLDEFLGFAFVVISLNKAFSGLTEAQSKLIELRAWVGTTDRTTPPDYQSASPETANPKPGFTQNQDTEKYGQPIALSWHSTQRFDSIQPFRARWIVLALSLSITALISIVLHIIIRRERTITSLVEQKSRQLETRETERRSIIENAMFAILSVTPSGKILHSNEAAQQLLLPKDRTVMLTGQKVGDLLPVLDLTHADGRYKLSVSLESNHDETAIIEVEKNTWATSEGETRITLLLRDITASEQHSQEIAKTEQRWNLALMGAQIGVFDINLRDQSSIVSDMWRTMLNIEPQPDTKDPYNALMEHIHPDDYDSLHDAQNDCINGTKDRAEARFRVKVSDTDWRWIQSDAIVVERAANGTALRMLGTQMDITESIKLDRMKRDFVATVSHELRTPLTSIKGALGLLESQIQAGELNSANRLIQIAQSNSDRLFSLVNDILDMEKMNAGRMTIDQKAESLNNVLGLISDQIVPYAAQWRVELEITPPPVDQTIWTDQKRVIQVLANLLSNACKFATEGTKVRLKTERLPKHTRISVTNTGAGIPEEFRSRIFQPFSQANLSSTQQKGGTGLGLNISRQLVEAMGGTIGFDSEPGKETVFWFTCPLAEQPAEAVS